MGRRAKKPRITIGERFGRLTVIKENEKLPYHDYSYLCRCDCGNETFADRRKLLSGHTTSCGCRRHEAVPNFTYSEHGATNDERLLSILNGKKNRNNTSGYTGVRYACRTVKGKKYYRWIAKIQFKGKVYYKCCDSLEEAIKARKKLENIFFTPIVSENKEARDG